MQHDCRPKIFSTGNISFNGLKSASTSHGFSLLEMLVVIALIAALTAMTLPSLKGLLGVGGRAGGASVVQSALEQARLAALESGQTTYVGFPLDVDDKDAAFSSLILFRDANAEELAASKTIVPLSRWLKLPQGVYLEAGSNFNAGTTNVSDVNLANSIPKLSTSGGVMTLNSIRAIAFDRFGKLKRADAPVDFLVGEKAGSTNGFSGFSNNYIQITVQPLTGRLRVVDVGRGTDL